MILFQDGRRAALAARDSTAHHHNASTLTVRFSGESGSRAALRWWPSWCGKLYSTQILIVERRSWLSVTNIAVHLAIGGVSGRHGWSTAGIRRDWHSRRQPGYCQPSGDRPLGTWHHTAPHTRATHPLARSTYLARRRGAGLRPLVYAVSDSASKPSIVAAVLDWRFSALQI